MFRQGKELTTRDFKVDKYVWNLPREERETGGAYLAICHDASKVCTKNLSSGLEIERYYKCKHRANNVGPSAPVGPAQTQCATQTDPVSVMITLYFPAIDQHEVTCLSCVQLYQRCHL